MVTEVGITLSWESFEYFFRPQSSALADSLISLPAGFKSGSSPLPQKRRKRVVLRPGLGFVSLCLVFGVILGN